MRFRLNNNNKKGLKMTLNKKKDTTFDYAFTIYLYWM